MRLITYRLGMGGVGREHLFLRPMECGLASDSGWDLGWGWGYDGTCRVQSENFRTEALTLLCNFWKQVVCGQEQGSKDGFTKEVPGILEIFIHVVPPSVPSGFEAHSNDPSYNAPCVAYLPFLPHFSYCLICAS